MSRNLLSGFGEIKRVRGQSSEERVGNALQFLQEAGTIDSYQRSDELEGKGIDYLVSRGSKKYKVSAKSSAGGVRHEREEHPKRYRHNDKIFIVPDIEESRENVACRILEMMEDLEQRFREND